jgi:hypothetical protein
LNKSIKIIDILKIKRNNWFKLVKWMRKFHSLKKSDFMRKILRAQLHFITTLMICFCLTVTACDTGKENNNNNLLLLAGVKTYAIGDTGPSGVGIVFYVNDRGLHGLEVAPVDQSTGEAWSNITGTAIGTTGLAIGTGSDNTDAIIGQGGHTAGAALICRNYRATEEGDWFLPSKDELDAIWDNGVGGFAGDYYWSSSEAGANAAWSQYFGDGSQYDDGKGAYYRVRAVRDF